MREKVGIFDQSSFAKYELTGRDALKALDWICANDVSKPAGRLTYTQLLNTRGGIEADLTVARLADDRFYIVTGTGFRTHDFAWIRDHIGEDLDASSTDVTEDFGTLSLMGPKARDVLAAVTDADVSNAAFPFGHVREIEIAGHTVRALRVTYVGELGWELHVPIAATGEVFDALMAAGSRTASGRSAIARWNRCGSKRATAPGVPTSRRMTRRSRPDSAGRSSSARTPTSSAGARWRRRNGAALKKRLAGFTVDDPDVVLLGRETILRNGEPVGYLTSGGYGYTVGKHIGFGYVRNADGVSDDFLADGDYELVVAMEPVKARIHMQPLYDPAGERVKELRHAPAKPAAWHHGSCTEMVPSPFASSSPKPLSGAEPPMRLVFGSVCVCVSLVGGSGVAHAYDVRVDPKRPAGPSSRSTSRTNILAGAARGCRPWSTGTLPVAPIRFGDGLYQGRNGRRIRAGAVGRRRPGRTTSNCRSPCTGCGSPTMAMSSRAPARVISRCLSPSNQSSWFRQVDCSLLAWPEGNSEAPMACSDGTQRTLQIPGDGVVIVDDVQYVAGLQFRADDAAAAGRIAVDDLTPEEAAALQAVDEQQTCDLPDKAPIPLLR